MIFINYLCCCFDWFSNAHTFANVLKKYDFFSSCISTNNKIEIKMTLNFFFQKSIDKPVIGPYAKLEFQSGFYLDRSI